MMRKARSVILTIPSSVIEEVRSAATRGLLSPKLTSRNKRALALLIDSLGGRIRVSAREWREILCWPE